MAVVVGVDIAKEFHWMAVVVVETGKVLVSKRVNNDPESVGDFLGVLGKTEAEHGPTLVGIDIMGGVASLFTAMCLEAGISVVHIPGMAVNRARTATRGGERKSDPRDAKIIADQLRLRDDWRPVTTDDPVVLDLRLLVSRRQDLVVDQTRRLNRIREMLTSYFPGLERAVAIDNASDLHLLACASTPDRIRELGHAGIAQALAESGVRRVAYADRLAGKAIAAAESQQVVVPGQNRLSEFVAELAKEALSVRERLSELEAQIQTALDASADAALVRSLPGMGTILTAEFFAEAGDLTRFASPAALASAAGLAPVQRQSGKVNYLRRATSGDRRLKRVFYQSAFIAIQYDPASKAFYRRKRAEGKRHDQSVIALARRRVDVLCAIIRTRQPYQSERPTTKAA